jgi:hypothetical protein
MPRPAEIEVEECAAPNGSYSLSAALGEAGQAAALAQRADAVAAAGQDLVRIGLVADVPDQPVVAACRRRSGGDGQFDHAQAGAEMAAGHRHGVDHLGAQLVGELAHRAKGITFTIYEGFGQDADGIWEVPGGGAKVAWFNDPDGNVLSLTEFG